MLASLLRDASIRDLRALLDEEAAHWEDGAPLGLLRGSRGGGPGGGAGDPERPGPEGRFAGRRLLLLPRRRRAHHRGLDLRRARRPRPGARGAAGARGDRGRALGPGLRAHRVPDAVLHRPGGQRPLRRGGLREPAAPLHAPRPATVLPRGGAAAPGGLPVPDGAARRPPRRRRDRVPQPRGLPRRGPQPHLRHAVGLPQLRGHPRAPGGLRALRRRGLPHRRGPEGPGRGSPRQPPRRHQRPRVPGLGGARGPGPRPRARRSCWSRCGASIARGSPPPRSR